MISDSISNIFDLFSGLNKKEEYFFVNILFILRLNNKLEFTDFKFVVNLRVKNLVSTHSSLCSIKTDIAEIKWSLKKGSL
jgi:hypothetical protein